MSSHRFHRFAQNFLLSVFSHGFLLRRVWHLAIPTPFAMGYSPTEYAEFTEPPTEMSSHGFHRFTQILRVRCSPTEFGSVGMAGMPYPPTSVNIRVIRGSPFFAIGSVSSVRSVGISFLPRISQIYTDTYGALFSHGIHRIHRICQRGYGRDAIPSYICEHPCHLWETLLCQKFLCVPCVLWEYLFSHRWHGWTQIVMVRCSPTEFTEYTELGSVGMAGMPYPPNLCSSVGEHRSLVGAAETAAPPTE